MRSLRLPPYMQEPVWRQLADAIDAVLGPQIDDGVRKLRDLSRVEHIHPENEHKSGNELFQVTDMLDAEGSPWLDKRLRVKQATDLGYSFSDSNSVPQDFYEMLNAQGPSFWGEAGTRSIAAFLGFLLNANIEMYPLWTSDYIEFVREVPEGGKITEGGEYYLTAHVDINVNGNISATINIQQLVELFYLIAPIHLVIHSAQVSFSQPLGDFFIAIAGRILVWEADPTPVPESMMGAAARMMINNPPSTLVL